MKLSTNGTSRTHNTDGLNDDTAIIRPILTAQQKFLTIARAAGQDDRLSLKARGLLLFIITNPDMQTPHTTKYLQSRLKEGRDCINSAKQELREFGYAQYKSFIPGQRVAEWQFADSPIFKNLETDGGEDEDWDEPVTGFPNTEKPNSGNPYSGNPYSGRPSTEKPNSGETPSLTQKTYFGKMQNQKLDTQKKLRDTVNKSGINPPPKPNPEDGTGKNVEVSSSIRAPGASDSFLSTSPIASRRRFKNLESTHPDSVSSSESVFPSESAPALSPSFSAALNKLTKEHKKKRQASVSPWQKFNGQVVQIWNDNKRREWVEMNSSRVTSRDRKLIAEFWSFFDKDYDTAIKALTDGIVWAAKNEDWASGKTLSFSEMMAKEKVITYSMKMASHDTPIQSEPVRLHLDEFGQPQMKPTRETSGFRQGATYLYQGAEAVVLEGISGNILRVHRASDNNAFMAYPDELAPWTN